LTSSCPIGLEVKDWYRSFIAVASSCLGRACVLRGEVPPKM
jgi:hypothetical protein